MLFKNAITILLAVLMGLFFLTCKGGGSPLLDDAGGDESPVLPGENIDKFFWGSWLGVGNEAVWYISGNTIFVDGIPISYEDVSTSSITLEQGLLSIDSDRILRYVRYDSTIPLYLFRASGATNTFSAQVDAEIDGMSPSIRGLSDLGGISVIVQNLDNPLDKQELVTDDEGNLETTETIIGDNYQITIPVQEGIGEEIGAIVTPLYDGQDLGIIQLAESGANFKMNLRTEMRPDMLRADGTTSYEICIDITNIGTSDMDEAQYSLNFDSGLSLISGQVANILGTVFAGETKTILIELRCSVIGTEWEDKSINITVTDIYGTQNWSEELSLRFLVQTPQFFLSTNSEGGTINGLILDPEGVPYRINSSDSFNSHLTDTTLLNWKPGDWTIIFGGGGSGQETKYALGVDAGNDFWEFAADGFPLLTDAGHGEPNNTSAESTLLLNHGRDIQYLGAKDVDFYRFHFDDVHTLVYNANGADSGTVPAGSSNSLGAEIPVEGNPGNLQKTGFTFAGWSLVSDHSDMWDGNPVETYTQELGERTLYAVWQENLAIGEVACGDRGVMILKTDARLWYTGEVRETPELFLTDVQHVHMGDYFSHFIMMDNSLWGYGSNTFGQLGNGTTADLYQPAFIMTGVASVADGYAHSLILKTDGTLWSTGLNDGGQLGDGTINNRSTPVQIMSNVASMAAGSWHTLILKTDGTLWAAGSNYSGQLGDGTFVDKSVPVQIMDDVAACDAGGSHSLILKTDGTLWAAGRNSDGQLGDSTTMARSTPVQIMTNVKSVSAGSGHSLIVKTDGTFWAAGYNHYGQLGDGTTENRSTPVQIMTGAAASAAGGCHSLVLKIDGTLWLSGDSQYGDSTIDERTNPMQIYP